jgi:uncharacterized caspase-like protein
MRLCDNLFKLMAAAFITALCLAEPAQADKRVALVIGNSAYKNIPRLENPVNDATLMADTLRSLGFNLIGDRAQLDLDKAGIDNAVQTFSRQVQGADVGLFYYAGHGVQVRGANYLVPVSANLEREADVDFQLVDIALVMRQMESAGTKLNLVILDACRNNPFGGRGLRSADGGLAQMRAPEGTLISYATRPGNVAQDGTGGNSPYTRALAQTMRKPGLDIFRVFNDVGLTVKQATGGAQQPWVSSSPIDGNFFFAAVTGGAPTPVGSPPVAVAPVQNEAAQAWSAVKDTQNPAVLDAFIKRYGTSFYADLARARQDELKKLAAVAPASRQSPPGTVEVWNVREIGPLAGTWTLTRKDDGTLTGKGDIRNGTFRVTYDLVVIERNGIVTAQRTKSSDGNDCNFTGNRNGKVIIGQYFCKNGGPFNWSAEAK